MTRQRILSSAGAVVVTVGLLALAPLEVVLGAGRLLILVGVVTGAWLTIGRAKVPDLSAGLHVAVGALLGGVTPATTGFPVLGGAVAAVLAGAATGAVTAALLVRAGRLRGAVATLACSAAAPALVAGWPRSGGVVGFHAVPLVTGSDAADLVVVALILTTVAVPGLVVASGPVGARAAVALAAPDIVEAEGRRAWSAAAGLGATGGALLATAGWGAAVLTGSVLPDAYGLPLAGLAAVGAVLAGGALWAPPVAALVLGAPAVLFPLVPVIGDAPPLLTTGVVAVAVVLWRGPLGEVRGPASTTRRAGTFGQPAVVDGLGLVVDGRRLPRPPRVDLTVAAGEIVQVRAPNGWGKSTLLAMVGGQLPDGGAVRLGGETAPAGSVARARLGVARTWQRPPEVRATDLVQGPDAPTEPGRAQIVAAVRRRPRLLLLDEPSAFLDDGELEQLLQGLRTAGTTVVVVEHHPVAGVDRTVELTERSVDA